jgi:hypothetical protein
MMIIFIVLYLFSILQLIRQKKHVELTFFLLMFMLLLYVTNCMRYQSTSENNNKLNVY